MREVAILVNGLIASVNTSFLTSRTAKQENK